MEGIRSKQQTIQNDFQQFGSEVIKGFSVDTGSIAGASQGDTLIAQLKAEMAKQQTDVANKLNTIMPPHPQKAITDMWPLLATGWVVAMIPDNYMLITLYPTTW